MLAARSVHECGLCAKLSRQITADSVAIVAGQHLKESERLVQLQLQLKNRRSSDTRTHRKTLLRETYS